MNTYAITTMHSAADMELLIEALEYRASRHESMARSNPRNAKPHDDTAVAMRRLRTKLLKIKTEAA